jgi:hypothetical protein
MNKENEEIEKIKNFNEEENNKINIEKKGEIKPSSLNSKKDLVNDNNEDIFLDKYMNKDKFIDEYKINLEKSNNKKTKKNFLSLSDIEFESFIKEKDNKNSKSKFSIFMNMKKYGKNYQNDLKIIEYDSIKEEIYLIINKKKIKIRLFIKSNCITAFNFSTNFSLNNSEFYPLINLDFDFLTAEFFVEKNINSINLFILGYNNKKFCFIIPNDKLFEKIIYLIQLILHNSKGYEENILTIVKRKEFYKVNKR